MMIGNIWDQVLIRIETKVNRHSFYTWFKPTSLITDGGAQLQVRVPSGMFRDWLTKHYSGVLDEALAEVDRRGCAVAFLTEDAVPVQAAVVEDPIVEEADEIGPSAPGGLAPRYSFD